MKNPNFSRRDICKILATAGAFATSPFNVLASPLSSTSQTKLPRVILFEMFGGNDNLNTLVPFKDPLYAHYRPTIGLTSQDYTPLSDDVAINNALLPLMPGWESGQLAILQDVGYPNSVLSHFKAIEVIETASSGESLNNIGWVAQTLLQNPKLRDKKVWDLDAIWAGGHMKSLVGGDLTPFSPSSGAFTNYLYKYNMKDAQRDTNTVGRTINNYLTASNSIKGKVEETSHFYKRFYNDDTNEFVVGKQCIDVMRFIESGVNAPIYKIGMSGFDLHGYLRGAHETVLSRAARHLANLRSSLIELSEWDNTLIVAYSEFGRRPQENASQGSDHGTATPMFFLGGKVNGGIKGSRSDLEKLNADGNIAFTSDYRSAFSTIISHWWKADVNPLQIAGHQPLKNIIG